MRADSGALSMHSRANHVLRPDHNSNIQMLNGSVMSGAPVRRSAVWQYYTNTGPRLGRCNACSKTLYLNDSSTCALWEHLKTHQDLSKLGHPVPHGYLTTTTRKSTPKKLEDGISHLRRRSLSSIRKAKMQKGRVSLNASPLSRLRERGGSRIQLNGIRPIRRSFAGTDHPANESSPGCSRDNTPRLRSQRHLFQPLPHVEVPSTSRLTGKIPSGPNKFKRQKKDLLTGRGKPAELFRTDLVSAMKVNDNEVLDPELAVPIADAWRSEWNLGVQVPVSQDQIEAVEFKPLNEAMLNEIRPDTESPPNNEFRLPKQYIHSVECCDSDKATLTSAIKKCTKTCRYDMDGLDEAWLYQFNKSIANKGVIVNELLMERIMECLETTCHQRLQERLLESGAQPQGREFDDDTVCDVCLSPFTEEGDEMVFCDRCDLCVHQSCYGIPWLPEGQWLCRLCSLAPARMPQCIFCPNGGGAMKCSSSGDTWAHIACVLWIPEVRFGDPDAREPVKNIKQVPEERWNLRCSLCRSRDGACIQCSEGNCHVAYHVTCAQKNGLKMLIQTSNIGDGVELNSFCVKHSSVDASGSGLSTPPPDRIESRGLPLSMVESPNRRRQRRLTNLEKHFYSVVNAQQICQILKTPLEIVEPIYEYWKMKRKEINDNCALIAPVDEEARAMARHEEQLLASRVKLLLTMRKNLEKARNLCYMVQKREKYKLQYVNTVSKMAEKLAAIFSDEVKSTEMTKRGVTFLTNYLKPMSAFDELVNSDNPRSAKSPVDNSQHPKGPLDNPHPPKSSVDNPKGPTDCPSPTKSSRQ